MSRRRRKILLYPIVLHPPTKVITTDSGIILKDKNGTIITTG